MLYNKTKKIEIIKKIKHADSFSKKLKGLLFCKKKDFDFALIFPLAHESMLEASIHMMFMAFPIDVLWLDGKKKVVDKIEGLKPWVLNASPKKPAKYIIELPAGKTKATRHGDEMEW